MAVSAANLVVGQGGTVMWGTTGVALPTSATSAATGFNDFGYLDEGGLTVAVEPSITDFPVWQSRQPGRREANETSIKFSGNFAEWNTQSVPKVFGGGSLTGGTYAFPADTTALPEFAFLADAVDGSDVHRFVFGRVNSTGAAQVQFNRTNLAILPFEFSVLAPAAGGSPGNYYTNG